MRIIPLFDSCCCVFSLKTGTILIGITQAVVMLIRMIYHINYPEKKKSQVYTTCAVYTVIAILDILLIFGAKNKYWLPVKLWIVFNTIIFMARAYLTCMELIGVPPLINKSDIVENVCKVYGLLVVNSYYQGFVAESTSGLGECKCHLQPDISILYIQNPVPEIQKHNQWREQLSTMPPHDQL